MDIKSIYLLTVMSVIASDCLENVWNDLDALAKDEHDNDANLKRLKSKNLKNVFNAKEVSEMKYYNLEG
jgi:hypothetical protein